MLLLLSLFGSLMPCGKSIDKHETLDMSDMSYLGVEIATVNRFWAGEFWIDAYHAHTVGAVHLHSYSLNK